MSRKKICLICTVTQTSGAFLVPMAEYFHQHKQWDISLLCSLNDPQYLELIPEGVRYIPMPMKRGISLGGIATFFKLFKLFRKEKFDLIQYCTPNASLYASLAGWMARVPVRLYCQWGMIFVSFPKGLKRWIFKTMEKTICRLSTHVQPDSHGNLNLCHELKLYPEEKGSVVWNGSTCGIDLKKFDISQKPRWRKAVRQSLNLPDQAVVFGFVGRITRDKGINELLTAFREIEQKYPDLYLILVGPMEEDGNVDEALCQWAAEHPRVRLCGYCANVEQYLSAMDCYVLPSYREGFGTSIIEAEAMELPIIATDIPGPREAMCQGVTGVMVSPRDSGALRAGMETMAGDAALREQYGKEGRRYVAERFEIRQFLQKTMEDRAQLLENHK